MGSAMGGSAAAVMIVMMIVMGGFSLAALARWAPAAWRARARQAIRRPANLPAPDAREGAR
jgi:hypothetical protein